MGEEDISMSSSVTGENIVLRGPMEDNPHHGGRSGRPNKAL